MANITCFGEVLWDVFPTHKKIGGAPLNVAARLQDFNNTVSMVSRVGKDKKGRKILKFLKGKGVNTDGVQIDEIFKTGKVKVTLDVEGSASYDIMFPRAWDKIELTDQVISIVENADAFVFGSLVARDVISRETLYVLLKLAKYKIFDVNLRAPHYTMDVLWYLINQADFVKFNDDEILEIGSNLGSKAQSLEEIIAFIAQETNAKTICVTKGGNGAILYYQDAFYYNSGYKVNVVDTVGAGDSFLASIITQLLNKTEPQEALDFACAVGAIVASREGANPEIKQEDIDKMVNS
ncbi:carbohydrate kinase [Algibacter amylolyticus]|uniref:Carbohydrate kinase n=1 Tax=Algibacter amylolyticus TaxID=1608400 RepID=A0A5M7AXI9_9FLAO|nr:carbohydrate kinase [Algibacter amylolyticus]KAA5821939.1 carbohydrate kinase [Algibacter amylolyticus]MBB5269262.1 fructokinase [Algibacter amylolyticus]TSJ73223.1 carbohydrate kinase [Algibacter amylolyticus]